MEYITGKWLELASFEYEREHQSQCTAVTTNVDCIIEYVINIEWMSDRENEKKLKPVVHISADHLTG